MKTKQYKYGSCIPESEKLYKKLKKQGKNPYIVEGWVEVDIVNDLLPDEYFLMRFYPKEFKKLKDINYNDYPKSLQHTWVELDGKIIDITKNQFDKYGGVIKYYKWESYISITRKEVMPIWK